MSTPLRVNDGLFKEAEIEASFMNRSTAKQVEFWAELGKRVAYSVSPADILALMQGIADIRVEVLQSQPINVDQVLASVDSSVSKVKFRQQITRGELYYEASKTKPGLLDQVLPDGSRQVGTFTNGLFVAR